MSVVKTDLVAQFGAYYINEGQDAKRLLSQIRQPSVTAGYAKPIIHDGDIYRFSNVLFQEVVQSFQKAFTPKGDITFKPNEIRLRNFKVDISLFPDDMKASWGGFLTSLTDQERKNWPLVRYMLESEVVPQLHSDMETKVYFKGVYAAPTAGVASTAASTMDGIKKLLDDGLAETDLAKKMQAVTLSAAVTNANIFDMVEEFADNIDETLLSTPISIYMSTKNLKAYLRDKRNTHGTDINYVAGKVTIDFADNIKLVGLPSMAGSPYIWATPDANYLYLRKVNGMSTPKVEEAKREVFLMLDWWEGIGFGYNPLVYVYKPA